MSKGSSEHLSKSDHQQRLAKLREDTHKKIDYQLQKGLIEPHDFYHLITGFFLELLEKEYHATYEEIIEELEGIEHDFLLFSKPQREKAEVLLTQLSHLEYANRSITQEDARQVLSRFRDLATEFTSFETESIERELRSGIHAAARQDIDAAKKFYQKAHELYQTLGESEQQRYYEDLQALFQKISA